MTATTKEQSMNTTTTPGRIVTASGATREMPAGLNQFAIAGLDQIVVAGLDEDGRIVVDHFGDLNKPYAPGQFLFGLTLCCNASDKGGEYGVVCRGCYGDDMTGADTGNYLFQAPDGSFPGLDPVVRFEAGA